MGLYQSTARLTPRDVLELDSASEHLAAAAAAIKRANPVWGESVVQLLILANNTVMRLHDKGAGAIARYLARHPAESTQGAPESSPAAETQTQAPNAAPGEQEA